MILVENKGAINHLFTHTFSVANVRNVEFIKVEKEGVKITIKVNKYCTAKIKQNLFNSLIYKQISSYTKSDDDNKENLNIANINPRRLTATHDEDYLESEVEEGERFSNSRARKRSGSLISK